MKKIRTLLAVSIYGFTEKEIANYISEFNSPAAGLRRLPTLTIREDGYIGESESEFQFLIPETARDNKNHILFNYGTIDENLREEISNAGIEDILKSCVLFQLFNKLKKLDLGDLYRGMPTNYYLIVDLCYSKSYTDSGWEYDLEIYLDHYLDENLTIKTIE
jgi:hypothetical protein